MDEVEWPIKKYQQQFFLDALASLAATHVKNKLPLFLPAISSSLFAVPSFYQYFQIAHMGPLWILGHPVLKTIQHGQLTSVIQERV